MRGAKVIIVDNFVSCDEMERALGIKNNVVRYIVREYLGNAYLPSCHSTKLVNKLPETVSQHRE